MIPYTKGLAIPETKMALQHMDQEQEATETIAEPIAPQEAVTVTLPTEEDHEARYKQLETEKENYKNAYLKEKNKNRTENFEPDEDIEERMRRIAQETLADSRLADITREQDEIIQKALKENKELKLAQRNQTDIPVSTTSSTEASVEVKDTLITPAQMAMLKAQHPNWTDKDFERYKNNLRKNMGL